MKPEKLFARTVKRALLKDRDSEIPAFLGNLSGVVDAGNGKVYVLLPGGEVTQVYNGSVPNASRLPVFVGYGGGKRLRVLRSRDVYTVAPYPDIAAHAFMHTFPGADTIPIKSQQFIPGLVEPYSGLTVRIHATWYELTDGWHFMPRQDIDLTSDIPATGALFTLLEVDSAGIISSTVGTTVDTRAMLKYSDIPADDPDKYALAAVKLYNGQSSFVFLPTDTDIIDLRFGSRGYLTAWDDIIGKPNLDVPVRGAYRWIGDGVETEFMLTDYLEELEQVFDNSLLVDPFVVNLSSDGGSVVFDDAPTDGHVIMAYGILRSL